MISYGLNGYCWTVDQAVYDALGEAMVTVGLWTRQCMMP